MRSFTLWESSIFHNHFRLLLFKSGTYGYINKLLSLLIKKRVYLILSLYVSSPLAVVLGYEVSYIHSILGLKHKTICKNCT